MSMTGKDTWVCTICGGGFTRRSTANRHNRNLHVGNGMIVRPYEYIIGRQNGSLPEPTDPLLFRKNNKKTQNSSTNNAAYPVCTLEFITIIVILRRIIIIITHMECIPHFHYQILLLYQYWNSYVFDLGDESFLDDQLKILRDIERTRSR